MKGELLTGTILVNSISEALSLNGIEVLPAGPMRSIPQLAELEPPCSLKWLQVQYSFSLGSFSYAVSGFAFAVNIGRYCSIGENVQFGRQNHPTSWVSTSPAFYLRTPLFNLPDACEFSQPMASLTKHERDAPSTQLKVTNIGHDVWIGHGAFLRAGVRVGTGAVIAANSVVVKDVPPYAVVAGNPATIKKMRVPPELAGFLLDSEWWNYAAWDIAHLPMHDPKAFLSAFQELKPSLTPYKPKLIIPGELGGHG